MLQMTGHLSFQLTLRCTRVPPRVELSKAMLCEGDRLCKKTSTVASQGTFDYLPIISVWHAQVWRGAGCWVLGACVRAFVCVCVCVGCVGSCALWTSICSRESQSDE